MDSGFKKAPEFRNQGYLTLSELGIGYRTSGVWKKKGEERKGKLKTNGAGSNDFLFIVMVTVIRFG